MTNLWLCDIDGTLVNVNHIHLASYKMDYKDVLNIDVPDDIIISTFGMSEAEMHKTVFRELNIPYDQNIVDKIIAGHPANFEKAIRSTEVKPIEGVVEFLTYLKNKNEYLGVYTGNLEKPAKLLLESSGLRSFFPIISYDDGKNEKWQIVQRAIDEARNKGHKFDRTIIIGDTTKDIGAGKRVNAYTIVVATGSDNIDKLRSKNPDLALASLKDYELILEELK